MYEVNEVYRAIQGEGFHAGTPCTIVRMQGCNLRCEFCDTQQAQQIGKICKTPLDLLLAEIEEKLTPSRVVLITGGEPLLQDLGPLTTGLIRLGLKPHLETNGTQPYTGRSDWITVSPKQSYSHSTLVRHANEVKWLVAADADLGSLLIWLDKWRWPSSRVVSLQPVSQDPHATKICYDACIKYGWRLSLQLHKYIGEK